MIKKAKLWTNRVKLLKFYLFAEYIVFPKLVDYFRLCSVLLVSQPKTVQKQLYKKITWKKFW